MSPIKPGTLCMVVVSSAHAVGDLRGCAGKTVTVRSIADWFHCSCGASIYTIDPIVSPTEERAIDGACRSVLQPILPPDVDISEKRDEILPEPVV